ncbi:MAG: putative hydro-lyase [Phycisphaerae bacterium]
MSTDAYAHMTGTDIRALCRAGRFVGPTAGVAMGWAQANLVVLRADDADDFHAFCRRNPRPCPLLDVTPPGCWEPAALAPGADVRSDLPAYRVYVRGVHTATVTSIAPYWRDDCVAFLIGCSFTFDAALLAAGLPVRHIEEGRNVPMYRTSIACEPAGAFHGPLIVSMRPMTARQAETAHGVTAAYPRVHGAPLHVGAPDAIGIADISRPDFGDAVTVHDDELPVFWACGVTPMEAIVHARPAIAITHDPGHMFVTDVRDDALRTGA